MIGYNKMVASIIRLFVLTCFLSPLVLLQANASPETGVNISTATEISTISLSPSVSNTTDKVRVVASFYPIFEFAKRVGGDRVEATSLIPVGTEPHDFDPTVQQVQNAETADMVVFNGAGFEGERLRNLNAKFVVDTSKGLNLTGGTFKDPENNLQANEISIDPHIWLDPLLAKQQVEQIRDGLIEIDPRNTEYYSKNANSFLTELDNLDRTIRETIQL
jgi:zinc transport system substrate-binding protein